MKILITGGAGYIGSILVPRLLALGHHVTALDSFLYGENSLATSCLSPLFDVHRVDVRDKNAVYPFIKDADVIIPLAGLVGAPLCDLNPTDAVLTNLRAPLALFDMARMNQLVIMPTTESSYGSNAEICTEETPLNPLSTYAQHKVEVEGALMNRENSISLRLATVFGMSPRMRLDLLINDFTWRAQRDRAFVVFEGHYRRTSVHVTDVARAFIHALDNHQAMKGNIYNVGAVSATKIEICEKIKEQVPYFNYVEWQAKPKDSWGKDPDQRNYSVSDAKIRATGFTPNVTLEQGIAELLKGYRTLSNNRYGNVP